MKHNTVHISKPHVQEIAEYLDAGMLCFYHVPTSAIEYYPDPLKGNMHDEEQWEDVINKIDAHYDEYVRFEGMESSESYRLMEHFIATIQEPVLQLKLNKAIAQKKPFQHFKNVLLQLPVTRERWFIYKKEQYMSFVEEQARRHIQ